MKSEASKIIQEMRELLPHATKEQRLKIMELITETLLREAAENKSKKGSSDYLDER